MKVDQFDREFVAATKRGRALLDRLPKAVAVNYDARTKRLVVDLQNGSTLIVPTDLIQGLKGADDRALSDFQLVLNGSQIHWRTLDIQMYVKSLIEGVFGTQSWMDRLKDHYASIGVKGGSARTAAKISASRENGKKGGRPRRPKVSG